MSRMRVLDELPWRGPKRDCTALVDPGSPNGLAVLNTNFGATRNISLSFYDNMIDPSLIETAARYPEEPMQFLSPGRQ